MDRHHWQNGAESGPISKNCLILSLMAGKSFVRRRGLHWRPAPAAPKAWRLVE
jgi:hypothetical protein